MQLPSPCWIISDVHLGAVTPDAERKLLAMLAAAPHHVKSLVINGDLFEFWFEWRRVIPRVGYRAVAALAALHEAGVQILFLGGNHDCWGGESLIEATGGSYHLGSWEGQIAGWKVR